MYLLYVKIPYTECQGTLYVEPGCTVDYTSRYLMLYVEVVIYYVASLCDLYRVWLKWYLNLDIVVMLCLVRS